MDSLKKKILMAFDDPGGGLAVSSLIEKIEKEINSDIAIYAGKLSRRFLSNIRSGNIRIEEIDSKIEKEYAEDIFEKENPDLLITGTGGGNAEQELRNVAYRKSIRSVVILDFWKDYSRRWKYSDYSIEDMNEKICVMDDLTKEEMEAENFKSDNLAVTGHPYLDRIFSERERHIDHSNQRNFTENILFLSQPLDIIGLKEYDIHPLENFLIAVSRIAEHRKQLLNVKIKLHPSEQTSEEISIIINKYNREFITAELVTQNISLNELISDADIVAGYNTIALFEARAAGKRAVSIRVADITNSLKEAMENAGIEITDPDSESISKCINEHNVWEINYQNFSGGIVNCVNVIKKELSLN